MKTAQRTKPPTLSGNAPPKPLPPTVTSRMKYARRRYITAKPGKCEYADPFNAGYAAGARHGFTDGYSKGLADAFTDGGSTMH
jgi:hypothetical protein